MTKKTIDSLLPIKEKRDRIIKGRRVAKGNQQKKHIKKDKVHPVMVATVMHSVAV